MMRTRLLICGVATFWLVLVTGAGATLITSSLDPALAGGDVITFDGLANGIYEPLTVGGVIFGGKVEIGNANFSSVIDVPPYLSNGYFNRFYTGSLTFTFTHDITAFGFLLGASNNTWTLTAYNSNNVVLDTAILGSTGGSGKAFYGLRVDSPVIAYVTLTDNGTNNDLIFIDDFTTASSSAPVPEPATLLLFGTGLAGLAGLRRRRQ